MKVSGILVAFALIATVNCTWFVGLVQPIILSFGAIFAALDSDLEPMLDIKPLFWFRKKDKDESQSEDKDEETIEKKVYDKKDLVEENDFSESIAKLRLYDKREKTKRMSQKEKKRLKKAKQKGEKVDLEFDDDGNFVVKNTKSNLEKYDSDFETE